MPNTPILFNAADWYWAVGGSTTQVYSSATGSYVPVTDPTYVAWKAVSGHATRTIDSEASLGSVLAPYLRRPTSAAPNVLDAYQDTQAGTIITQAIFKILFNHENRIRAAERALALNGSPANLTPAQARNAVKALL